MRNRLLNLYSRNAQVGAGIKAEGNTIYLYDYIAGSEADAQWWGGVSAEGFTRQLMAMEGDVSVRIDSPGGDVFGGRAIAQAIREYDGKVTCHIDGLAASAASYIAISGDHVVAAPGAFMMIHRAWTLMIGNSADFRAEADLLDKIDASIAASYAAKAGGETDWIALMDKESWFTGDEALALGLIDEVLPEQGGKAANAGKRGWNLSAFDHPPVNKIPAPASEPAPEPEPEPAPEPTESDEIAARERRLAVDLLTQSA
ncbi:ATP-dependent Clp protease proteolytic subunit [Sphingobium herbicidovorans NBRC 16415]|uniref:ATP-dependent Clp protease proteolytic subunit n=1 Tax=Sphingobium herbicidovorans (strain ATCC 700291 / DSM 11019 / CCUG 56400 / KCTC 2939 / LMG 18315 / NBRC 16415 / MH) TaxID=1219045 RepID=A0A086PE99_SPHHM|nr:head maturation protease, ClpP-related [Sphingobium herbicidovorans]KFG91717.1 ATP-dependent Clp protease proteolytic subunit [Sphingobium herbicidovorans NBRC 16415]